MKTTIIIYAAATILATLSAGAHTAAADTPPPTGYQLYADCNNTLDSVVSGCLGYIGGVLDALIIVGNATGEPLVCGSGPNYVRQSAMIFLKWAKDNPTQLSRTRGNAVILAMADAYPCDVPAKGGGKRS